MAEKARAQWAALRRLAEGARPDLESLALATGRSVETIGARAKKEGWAEPGDARRPADTLERIRRQIEPMLAELEALNGVAIEGGAAPDKARIDRLTSMIRVAEKLGEVARTIGAKEVSVKREADLAGVLKRIDKRIIELATGYAQKLVAKQFPSGGG